MNALPTTPIVKIARARRIGRFTSRAAVMMLVMTLPPSIAYTQGGPSLNDLAIDWSRGGYASPLTCEVAGELVRAVRRVIITPALSTDRRGVAVVHFVDMKPGEAKRCFNLLGEGVPNILGKVELRLPGRPHPETAQRDLRRALLKDRGFEFDIVRGSLKIIEVGPLAQQEGAVDFRGGDAGLRLIAPATDAARELAEFASPRKVLLELESREGERLSIPLFLASER